MSFFGPEKDKERLLSASRTLYDCVYMFISSTNTIFRMLNQFLGTEFAILTVRESLSIKENLQLLGSALKEMQEAVELKDQDIQQIVSFPLYSKIILPSASTDDKIRLVRDIYGQYKGVFTNLCGPISVVLMKHGNLPGQVDAVVRELLNNPAISLRVGDLLLTHEEIAKALPEPNATSSQNKPSGTDKVRLQSVPSIFSITNFMRVCFRGQTSNVFELAADCLEEAVKILQPACENFQRTVKMAEDYVTLIIDKLQ
uniref:Uncharacterized protein n=1 Tax=Salvator merianae TaxID=96440 RepID=A0A8D0CE84_SALMN